jgi:hypothetical protein
VSWRLGFEHDAVASRRRWAAPPRLAGIGLASVARLPPEINALSLTEAVLPTIA